jgi:hypothetical protein
MPLIIKHWSKHSRHNGMICEEVKLAIFDGKTWLIVSKNLGKSTYLGPNYQLPKILSSSCETMQSGKNIATFQINHCPTIPHIPENGGIKFLWNMSTPFTRLHGPSHPARQPPSNQCCKMLKARITNSKAKQF